MFFVSWLDACALSASAATTATRSVRRKERLGRSFMVMIIYCGVGWRLNNSDARTRRSAQSVSWCKPKHAESAMRLVERLIRNDRPAVWGLRQKSFRKPHASLLSFQPA